MPLTILGQETRWAYSTPPPSPHGAAMRWAGCEKSWASECRRTRVPGNFFTNIFFVTVNTRTGRGMECKGRERGESGVTDRLGYLSRRRLVAIVTPLQSVRLLQWLPLSCLQAQLDCVQVWIQPPTAIGCRGNVPWWIEERISDRSSIQPEFYQSCEFGEERYDKCYRKIIVLFIIHLYSTFRSKKTCKLSKR